MVAPRPVNRNFEQFQGVDRYASPLSGDRLFARQADNAQLVNNSLIMRRGTRPVVAVGADGAAGSLTPELLFTVFFEDDDLLTIQENLAVLTVEHDIVEFSSLSAAITLTNSVGSSRFIEIYPAENAWTVDLKDSGGTSLTGWPKTYGDGKAGYASTDLLSKMVSDLNAVANLTCTYTSPFITITDIEPVGIVPIVVGGGKGDGVTVPASDGLELTNGSAVEILFYGQEKIVDLDVAPYRETYNDVDYSLPAVLAKRNVTYIARQGYPLLKYDGIRFSKAGMPSNILGIASTSLAGGALTGSYTYFVDYVKVDARNNIIRSAPTSFNTVSPSSQDVTVNFQSPAIGRRIGVSTGVQGPSGTIEYTIDSDLPADKIPQVGDKLFFTRSGKTSQAVLTVTAVATTGATTKNITVSGFTFSVTATDEVYQYNENFEMVAFRVAGTVTNSTTITVNPGVSGANGNVEPKVGEKLFFPNGETRTVVSYTPPGGTGTIVVDDPITLATGDFVSNNVRCRIWRNTDGGTIWYKVAELPIPPARLSAGIFTDAFVDDVVDSDLELNEQWEEPIYPPSEPRKCSVVTEHQGLITTAGNPDDPNSFDWEDPEIPESFPLRNSKLVPSKFPKGITALGSEGGVLNIFKERSHFPLFGDLDAGELGLQFGAISEGFVGVASHASLALVDGVLFGCSLRGPITVQQGRISTEVGLRVRTDFLNQEYRTRPGDTLNSLQQTKLVPRRAVGIIDPESSAYRLFVPAETGDSSDFSNSTVGTRYANSNSREYLFDLENQKWFDVKRPEEFLPSRGYAVYNQRLHLASYYDDDSSLFLIHKETDSGSKYDYVDNSEAILFDVWLQHEGTSAPELEKEFQALRFYLFNLLDFYSFSLRVRTYRNWGDTTAHTDKTIVFSDTTNFVKTVNLAMESTEVLQIRLTVSGYAHRPLITGYSFKAALTQDEEEFERI
jgi:hypothetical protein